MNKKIFLIGIASLLCVSCTANTLSQHKIVFKKWHTSPTTNPRSSTIYPVVSWDTIQKIKIGMNKSELQKIIHDVQNYHHPINAIVFTENPNGVKYEVAIKLSKEGIIEDLSFKK